MDKIFFTTYFIYADTTITVRLCVRWLVNGFIISEWQSQKWKFYANHLRSDQKIVMHGDLLLLFYIFLQGLKTWSNEIIHQIVYVDFPHNLYLPSSL